MPHYARTPKQIGEVLRRIRRTTHLTQGDLGEKAGLWQETISKVEGGSRGTKLETFCNILAALDLELVIISRRKGTDSEDEEFF